ncbi:MAG TPA: VOC family protein [Acidimicrobiales bacterium]|nr:VOC family protein [Acidimicrobiales bacterium]
MSAVFSHFGICVSDMDRSLRFYCEALGFEKAESFDIGDDFAALMELERVELRSQYIRRDGLSIELLAFASPPTVGEPVRRPVNQLGLTHLSFRVDDVDSVAAGIAALGGAVHAQTRTTFELGGGQVLDFVYCTDPDGTRIELMNLPG